MRDLPLILVFTSLFSGWAEAQTLGDIARQERARQQSAQTRIRITNDSIDYVRSVEEPAREPAAESSLVEVPLLLDERPLAVDPPTATIPSLVIDDPVVPEVPVTRNFTLLEQEGPPLMPPMGPTRDEEWWRAAFQEARSNLKQAEDRVILLEVQLSRARLDQLEFTSNTQRARAAAEVSRLTEDVDRAQKDVVNARKTINDLHQQFDVIPHLH